jgi:cytochrome c553
VRLTFVHQIGGRFIGGRFLRRASSPRSCRRARGEANTSAREALSSRMFWIELIIFAVAAAPILALLVHDRGDDGSGQLSRGRYLAQVGACAACHTPSLQPTSRAEEDQYRADPDWYSNLDHTQSMSGGVPFIIRINKQSSGVVYSRNITPDRRTGIGTWTTDELVRAIRTGVRPDGTSLFLFAPHTFFKNLTYADAQAIAAYLQTLAPIENTVPERQLPFEAIPATDVNPLRDAPTGRTRARAQYLLDALVGCAECHSYHDDEGKLVKFAGGDPREHFIGVFRLGPDLPLNAAERGLAAFPYPGYAVIYGGNLTKFGKGGELQQVSVDALVDAMRKGVSAQPDRYGRPRPLGHVMLWQFYAHMKDDDAYAIADYIKDLKHIKHPVPTGPILFGDDWKRAFEQAFGEYPSRADAHAFGK